MPPRPPLANTIKFEVTWTGPEGAQATNILYVLGSGAFAMPEALANLNTALDTFYTGEDALLDTVSELWELTEIRSIDNSGETEDVAVINPDVVGLGVSPALPPSAAGCVSWPIAAHYRGGHPRLYQAGLMESGLATPGGKFLSSAAITNLEAYGSDLIAAVAGAALTEGVTQVLGTISYYADKVLRTTPIFRAFLGAVVGSRLDSQRRRLGKEPALVG